MSETRHERPGVYSVYDASSVMSAGRAAKRIGVAALAVKGTANEAVTLTGYSAGVETFGEDNASAPGMSTLLKLLFANGASTVCAVRVGTGADLEAYQTAFAALTGCDVQVVVCDSSEMTIQKALKTAVETASAARGERIGVIGGSGDTAAQLVIRAAAINSERMVLVGPDMKTESGTALSGVFAAAAVAGAIACGSDPAVPLNGAALYGIGSLQSAYTLMSHLTHSLITPFSRKSRNSPDSTALSARNRALHSRTPRRRNIPVVFSQQMASQVSSPVRTPSGSPPSSTSVAVSQPRSQSAARFARSSTVICPNSSLP